MHTTYTWQRREGGSLKNTKINYTKDLLRHCVLNLWEDFAILCVFCRCQSRQSVLFRGKKQIIFIALLSAMKGRYSVFLSSQWWHIRRLESRMTDLVLHRVNLSWATKEGGKLMSSFSKDKCFNCYHTDFLLSFKRMQPQPSSTLYIILCSLCLHPPRIHKIDTQKTKTKKCYHWAQAGSQFVKTCKCFSKLLNYWNKPKIDFKWWKGTWLKKIMCF